MTTVNGKYLRKVGNDYVQYNFTSLAELISLADGRNVEDAIKTLEAAIGNVQNLTIVPDMAGRNALTGMIKGEKVFVIDASGDASVKTGWAEYLYDGSQWLKIAEGESLDISLKWADIEGKPSATAAALDSAVTNSHNHSNKAVVDKFTETSGILKYNGNTVAVGEMFITSATEPTGQPEGGLWIQPV